MQSQKSQKVADGLATTWIIRRMREPLRETLEWQVALKRRPRVYI